MQVHGRVDLPHQALGAAIGHREPEGVERHRDVDDGEVVQRAEEGVLLDDLAPIDLAQLFGDVRQRCRIVRSRSGARGSRAG